MISPIVHLIPMSSQCPASCTRTVGNGSGLLNSHNTHNSNQSSLQLCQNAAHEWSRVLFFTRVNAPEQLDIPALLWLQIRQLQALLHFTDGLESQRDVAMDLQSTHQIKRRRECLTLPPSANSPLTSKDLPPICTQMWASNTMARHDDTGQCKLQFGKKKPYFK
jgi:hypothetical protein